MLYFAYGSNCNPRVMERKSVRFVSRQHAVLAGFELLFNKKASRPHVPAGVGYANIALAEQSRVEGILYRIVPDDLPLLDASERYPDHYTRIEVRVESGGTLAACSAYQAHPARIAVNLSPEREYLNHILAAQEYFTAEYYAKLSGTRIFSASPLGAGE